MSEILKKHRDIWYKKKIIRIIYSAWYEKILKDIKQDNGKTGKTGKTLEIGAGSGNFKLFKPDSISSDIDLCEWLDISFDAHNMPFKNHSISNIVMIDVLHHLANPIIFLKEARRILKKDGRLIMLEPYPSPFSLFIYRKFHPEPYIFDIDYFEKKQIENKNTWDANQAIAYLLFFKHIKKTEHIIGNDFKIIKREKLSCILYPASGGFENKSFIPDFLIPLFQFFEFILIPFHWLMAFRCYIVLETK